MLLSVSCVRDTSKNQVYNKHSFESSLSVKIQTSENHVYEMVKDEWSAL